MEAFSLSCSVSIAPRHAVATKNNHRIQRIIKRTTNCCHKISNGINHASITSSCTEKSSTLIGHDDGIGIVKFLKGKTFLITGATGFLGKVLVEKMLRSAPDIHKIFVLIKPKNNQDALQRLKNEIIDAELFEHLRRIHGKSYQAFMLSKLIPVAGNVRETNLGLDQDTAHLMSKEVDIVINSAANTTFDERYDTALDVNTIGPARLMRFAKQCHKLSLFLQVSTAYVSGQRRGRIMEERFEFGVGDQSVVYKNRHQPSLPELCVEDEIKIASEESKRRGLEDSSLIRVMKDLGLHRSKRFGWQDTYGFTKAMGEMMIDSMRGDIPVVVIRPSVVESTYKEPFPGWIEGNRMMDPVILQYGKGKLAGFLADPDGVLDVVPADMVVNATLAAMAKHESKPECGVYHVASSVVNPLGFRDLAESVYQHFDSSPFIESSGRPVLVRKVVLFSSMDDFASHLWRHTNGESSRKLETIRKRSMEQAKYLANIYESYTFYGGRFDNSNTKRLMGFMSKEERREFGFEVEMIDWKDYIANVHIPGLRKHVVKGRGQTDHQQLETHSISRL